LNVAACREQLHWRSDHIHVLFNANGRDPVKRPALARAAVERMKEMGIRAELHEMAGLPNEQVPLWLNAADVLLPTSLHEGSPTVVKEALACNLPIVSVEVGDVPERIKGIEGCYLASADPVDLAAKLRLVCQERRRLDARPRMLELSLESSATKLAAFYAELTGMAL
jgi:glycosyltransferase involved in cell wall biosynthesis